MITPLYGQIGVIKLGGTKPVLPNISGLQLWLDAADATTLYDATSGGNLVSTDGATVARWQDKSGNGRHISQATANARPALKKGIKNAKNVIRFDGANDILSIANSTISQNTGVLNLFAVCRSTKTLSASVYQTVIHNSNGTTAGPARSSIYISNAIEVGGRRLDADSYQFVKPGTLATNEWVLAGANFNYNAASLTAYKNGTGASRSPSFQTVGTTPNTPSVLFGIGGSTNSGEFLTGDIAEIIIYNTELTTAQRQSVESYLNAKWAIY